MSVISTIIPSLIFVLYYIAVIVAEVANNKDYSKLKHCPTKTIGVLSLILVPVSSFCYVIYGIKLDMYILFYSIGFISMKLIILNLLNGGKVRILFTLIFQLFVIILFTRMRVKHSLSDILIYISLAEVSVGIISCIK